MVLEADRRARRRAARSPVLEGLCDALESLDLRGAHLLVAASAGIDSSVLLHGLAALRERFALSLSVAHVDHGLRGDASAADAAFVAALAQSLALPFFPAAVTPGRLREGGASRERPSPQEAARLVRYEALERLRRESGAALIATAHHANDQAETLLLRLLRGTGPDGLAGIAPISPTTHLVRPLLRVSRAQIEAYAARLDIRFREDASNQSRNYARNRLRHDTIPALLKDFNPGLLRSLGDLAETSRADRAWLDGLVEAELAHRLRAAEGVGTASETRWELDREGWSELPEALARRVVVATLKRVGLGREVSAARVSRLLEFTAGREGESDSPSATLELPGGTRWRRERHRILIETC